MYEMKEEYKTGIDIIDEEHRHLFEIADEAYHLLHDEFIPDKYDNIVALVEELRDYTKKHFSDEEAYMESINYKRMFSQKIEHQTFIEKINELDLNELDANQTEAILDLLKFLNDWLIHHIVEKDKLIGEK